MSVAVSNNPVSAHWDTKCLLDVTVTPECVAVACEGVPGFENLDSAGLSTNVVWSCVESGDSDVVWCGVDCVSVSAEKVPVFDHAGCGYAYSGVV